MNVEPFILSLRMIQPNEAEVETIGDYFKALALEVWVENEGFSGKRPFGNSGWDNDIFQTLAMHGVIEADKVDEDGWYFLSDKEEEKGDKLIKAALREWMS